VTSVLAVRYHGVSKTTGFSQGGEKRWGGSGDRKRGRPGIYRLVPRAEPQVFKKDRGKEVIIGEKREEVMLNSIGKRDETWRKARQKRTFFLSP